ncbi:stress-activated map kinase-interacting protein [Histoplasma capsulatum var. duboisii H88]|uniref:Stress-activated map kinase-interacting protein n=1 Tax=Ajellomyces capsulatus (strain H88) TaxID=544711 RepID=F0UJT4_AJEC8|nr:stress-activated map kinase-interacting protein [Histoplasma capsulatum var. duboisii H88]
MSLLQNEDFTIWQLRTSYLSAIRDGVGDRLININSSILNTPSFRAAGWSSAPGANASHIKRTYSPPIPTATAVTSEYFQVSARQNKGFGDINGGSDGHNDAAGPAGLEFGMVDDGEEEEGGMVTGPKGSVNTITQRQPKRAAGRKGRRKERLDVRRSHYQQHRLGEVEDNDSSDLSDESDEEVEGVRERRYGYRCQQIKFTKMPVRRTRAGSSPIRSLDRRDNPDVFVTSPSLRSVNDRYRRGSLGAVEAVKARARRNTGPSSDMSSDNEAYGPAVRRRQIHFSNHEDVINPNDKPPSEKLDEEDELEAGSIEDAINDHDEDSIAESEGSVLSSEFGGTAGSGSLLDRVGSLDSASPMISDKLPLTLESQGSSPRKQKQTITSPELNVLPPPRPISTVEPISLLSTALRARRKAPANPLEIYAALSGRGSNTTPLYINFFIPSSSQPDEPLDVPIVRESKDLDHPGPVTVAQAIGLGLWRYMEERRKPPLEGEMLNVNRWNLRMIEDGEVDYDFPCLARGRPIIDFTSNNNRAPTARGRSRSKPYDEFALVKATAAEFAENEKQYPTPSADEVDEPEITLPIIQANQDNAKNRMLGRINPILGQPFSSALNDSTLTPADRPAVPTSYATPRMGVTKTLKVRYIDLDATQTTSMNTSTDSYIAEILDSVCKKWGLDKGQYLLKVMGSNTVAPLDRTVEALGSITDLDLVRRRFGTGPLSITGSPVSVSPNAPLMVENTTSHSASSKKGKKGGSGTGGGRMLHPLAHTQDLLGGYYRRYNVIRKQSMSFTASNQRVLAFDMDYMHIMPAETGKTLFESNSKTTSISFNDVVGSKVSRRHPKSFRVVVLRGNAASEQKRYDFEAKSRVEAAEIVEEIKKNMLQYHV